MKKITVRLGIVLIAVTFIGIILTQASNQSNSENEMKIKYENIENESIRLAFDDVFRKYEKLHPYEISLIQKRLNNSTMAAQPIVDFSTLFSNKKKYKIKLGYYVRDAEDLKISELPEEVLRGWFAHELGHLVDYEFRSNLSMIGYGMRYSFSDSFKREVEHQADSIAIEHGFHEEIIATKRFLLEHDLVSNEYKEQLNKFYMPISGVEMCVEQNKNLRPTLD